MFISFWSSFNTLAGKSDWENCPAIGVLGQGGRHDQIFLGLCSLILMSGGSAAQEDRRCCHTTEGVWLDGTYTPSECHALGDDFAPQGDARAAMCTGDETTIIPPSPPGSPGSPGGGPGGDPGGYGGGGSGDGGDGDGSGAGLQRPGVTSLAGERVGYKTVGSASLGDLGVFRDRAFERHDFCIELIQDTGPEDRAAGQASQQCFNNLRANANLVAQNAGRMRNSRDLSESEREEAAHIFQDASGLRSEADERLEAMGGG